MGLTSEDREWIAAQIREQRQELQMELKRVETRLLAEFHKWASPAKMRLRSQSLAIRAVDLDLGDVMDRLKKMAPPE